MKERIENPAQQGRLRFNREGRGWYKYGRIPLKVFYDLNCPTLPFLNEKRPGHYRLTADMPGPGESVSVFVHRSVPRAYKHIVAFHELFEAELVFADNVPTQTAHQQAVGETEKYAQRHLSEEEFQKFLTWNNSLDQNENADDNSNEP